ncbi:MAG: STAS domain-containing protein [Acidobacteriota bacterium]|nr:STAS domain-containing protein [Acidobacteriota bacterium]MDH3785271.1 STAS domain-containing protein [Acidobacteriota bacterium]
MNITRTEDRGIAVFAVAEKIEIDLNNCDAFKNAFSEQIAENDKIAVLDAANIQFFDSAGMGALLAIHKQFKAREGTLHLATLSRSVQEIFGMVGFDVVFPVHPDVSAAVESALD